MLLHSSERAALSLQTSFSHFYLNVFGETVENLLGHRHGFGEVLFAWLIDHVLARVVPVEITDGLLQGEKRQMNYFQMPSQSSSVFVMYLIVDVIFSCSP